MISKSSVELGEATSTVVPVAVLRLLPEELVDKASLDFQEGLDDLDYLLFSELQLPSNRPATLVYHQNSPKPGTEICVAPEESNSERVIAEVMQQLQLPASELLWVRP